MTNERKIFIAGFAVLLVIIVWMFMRVENLEKEMTSQYESQQQQRRSDLSQAKAEVQRRAEAEAWEEMLECLNSERPLSCR